MRKGAKMKIRSDLVTVRKFVLFHCIVICGVALFPLYRYLVSLLPENMTGCVLHDWLFLYCPLCGATRAVDAILHFRFLTAFHANAFITGLFFVCLMHYVFAWVRFVKGGQPLFRIYTWEWIAVGVLFLFYAVLRNLLLIKFDYDPLGDLAFFWQKT